MPSPEQKTRFVVFCRTIYPDNAGGWWARVVAKHFLSSPSWETKKEIQPEGLSLKVEKIANRLSSQSFQVVPRLMA